MNTKTVGTICELRILTKMVEGGYAVSLPFGENSSYDLIADKDLKLLRIQCKSGRIRKGSLVFSIGSVQYSKSVGKHIQLGAKTDSIDAYGVYCPDNGECYLFPVSEIVSKKQCNFRIESTTQVKGIKWAKDYIL